MNARATENPISRTHIRRNADMTNATLLKLSEEKPAPTGTITNPALAQEVLDAFDARPGCTPAIGPHMLRV